MKIGILTLPPGSNYGGTLQAYALQTVLERMGHKVVILDGKSTPARKTLWQTLRLPLRLAKRLAWKGIHPTRGVPLRFGRLVKATEKERTANTDRFIKTYLHKTPEKDFRNLHREDFDAIVVGSDQVWRPKFFCQSYGKPIKDAYLSFTEDWDIRRIAYAASFGTDEWEYTKRQTETCGRLLKKFDAVSLREASAVEIVKFRFDVSALHLLDPTMLLQKEDYSHLVEKAEQDGTLNRAADNKPFIFSYILDETKAKGKIIDAVATAKGLKVVKGKSKDMSIRNYSRKDGIAPYVHPSVEAWLRNFRDCEYVVTDSFHGTVFSILNEKQFIVIGNKERGLARFESLLGLFGLESRMVTADMDYQGVLFTPIDYAEVRKKLEKMRAKSHNFLEEYLGQMETSNP